MVPVLSRSREFSLFLDGTGTGTGKNWSRKKVPVPVPEKFGPGKKYRSRYRKKLVPEKSTGTGIGENWSRYRRIPGNSRSLYILISSCTLLQICNAFPAESSPSSIWCRFLSVFSAVEQTLVEVAVYFREDCIPQNHILFVSVVWNHVICSHIVDYAIGEVKSAPTI